MNSSAVLKFSHIPSIDDCRLLVASLFPGGHVAAIVSPGALYHRTAVNLEDAGFEIRDQICWILEDRTIPVVLARKPLSEGTVIANVLKWETGALNLAALMALT